MHQSVYMKNIHFCFHITTSGTLSSTWMTETKGKWIYKGAQQNISLGSATTWQPDEFDTTNYKQGCVFRLQQFRHEKLKHTWMLNVLCSFSQNRQTHNFVMHCTPQHVLGKSFCLWCTQYHSVFAETVNWQVFFWLYLA